MTTSKEQRIREKNQRIRDAETSPTDDPPRRPRSTQQPRVKPIRRTVDLPAEHHRQLDTWCAETARELGRARVTGQDVLRTLVAELLRDETTARKVRKALRENQ